MFYLTVIWIIRLFLNVWPLLCFFRSVGACYFFGFFDDQEDIVAAAMWDI